MSCKIYFKTNGINSEFEPEVIKHSSRTALVAGQAQHGFNPAGGVFSLFSSILRVGKV